MNKLQNSEPISRYFIRTIQFILDGQAGRRALHISFYKYAIANGDTSLSPVGMTKRESNCDICGTWCPAGTDEYRWDVSNWKCCDECKQELLKGIEVPTNLLRISVHD